MEIYRLLIYLIIIQLFVVKATESGDLLNRCIGLVNSKEYDKAIEDSRLYLKKDKWDAESYSCLSIAYYLKGKRDYAIRKLKEAEESIPLENIEKIHDIIWDNLPELLAEKEYKNNYTLKGGACILRNLTSIKGSGILEIGLFYDPLKNKTDRHLRAYKCRNLKDCIEIDHICPRCQLIKKEAALIIKDYDIVDIKRSDEKVDLSRNIRYIRRILELQRIEVM